MKDKRYAIVRADDKSDNNCKNCEMLYTNDNGNNDCRLRIGASFLCDRYGDTKEQLVNKIAQVIRRYRKNLEVCDYCDMKDEFEIAEKVVEFLGVK